MSTQIAALNVKLFANVAGFASGMKSAVAPLKNFGANVTAIGSKVVAFGGALTAVAAGAGMTALIKSSFASIDATSKLADRIGISTEALTGLQHAANLAGVSQEQLSGGLSKMLNNLGEAAAKTTPVSAALAKLGLNAQTLANEAPDAAFRAIAEGLKGITNPAERAAAAVDIFGKSGQDLLPLMMSGAAGIKAAQAEAAKLGLSFSRIDGAKIEAANDSMTRLSAVFTGVAQTAAIQLAPWIDALATKIVGIGTSGDGMASKVNGAFEMVAKGIAVAADYLSLLKSGWHAMRVAASSVLWALLKPIDALIQGLDFLYQKLTNKGPSQVAQISAEYMRQMEKDIGQSFDAMGDSFGEFVDGKNSAAVTRMFTNIKVAADASAVAIAANAEAMRKGKIDTEDWAKKLADAAAVTKRIEDTITSLAEKVNTFGMSEGDKTLFNLNMAGASDEDFARAVALTQQFDALNAAKAKADKLASDSASIFEATRTPMEQYETQISKLSDLLEAGGITWDVYGRAIRQAREELETATKLPEVPDQGDPTAMKAGSAAAQRYLYDLTSGSQRMAKDDVPKRQLSEQQDTNRILERVERKLGTTSTAEIDI